MSAFSSVLTNFPQHHLNQAVTVTRVDTPQDGIAFAEEALNHLVTRRTVLYLSGGNTPKALYTNIARHEKLHPGAVGLVDERFGEKFHDTSNERMIQLTGLPRYLELLDIPYYPILQPEMDRLETAQTYDEKLRHLHATFPQSLAVLGIGTDGHISSIAPNTKNFKNPMFERNQQSLFVSELNDPKRFYGARVGMTFTGLSMIDILIVLAFGEDKKAVLEAMFEEGPEEEIPARFFKRSEIARKTLLITDQTV